MQLFGANSSSDATILYFFLPMKTWKNQAQKLLIIHIWIFSPYCPELPIWTKIKNPYWKLVCFIYFVDVVQIPPIYLWLHKFLLLFYVKAFHVLTAWFQQTIIDSELEK